MPTSIKNEADKTNKKPCSGYDYDETLCKTVSDRLLCGYNKNIGDTTPQIINLGNGCRIRNNRIECGYIKGPFNSLRRPPANNYNVNNTSISSKAPLVARSKTITTRSDNKLLLSSTTQGRSEKNTTINQITNYTKSNNTNKHISRMISPIKTSTTLTTKAIFIKSLVSSTTSSEKVVKYMKNQCVEIGDSLFCYPG